MAKQHLLETEIKNILDVWNKNCIANGIAKEYNIICGTRDKSYKFSDKNNVVVETKVHIGELLVFLNNGITRTNELLHRIEIPVEGKVGERMTELQWKNELYRSFIYDCIGTFSMTLEGMRKNGQTAEYDIDKDRLKGDPQFYGQKIKVDKIVIGAWYKEGEEYEIFAKSDTNNWGVYSYRQEHKNGIGVIPMKDCYILK